MHTRGTFLKVNPQRIVAGEPAVSQDRGATDIQQSYVECNVLNFT